jgi:DNA-directed RNA polymerase specialized sigma24 family protein
MDKGFFVKEIEAHSGMMYRIAFTILRNSDDCRDALQEAL